MPAFYRGERERKQGAKKKEQELKRKAIVGKKKRGDSVDEKEVPISSSSKIGLSVETSRKR